MKKRILPVLFALLLALLTSCGSDAVADTTTQTAETTDALKTLAPDFTVVDSDGNKVSLSDMIGKPVVLNFWASWCGPCKNEMPDFEEIYKQYSDQIQFMMVNLTDGSYETLDSAKDFLKSVGYTFPVFFDTASEASAAYGISAIPTTYFIDAEGYAVAYTTGSIDQQTLLYGISMIYDGIESK